MNPFTRVVVYTGPDDDRFKRILSALKASVIKYQFKRDIPHSADIYRGAGVGRYCESNSCNTATLL